MKKLLALALAALLILALIACNKQTEEETEEESEDVLAETNVYEHFTYDVNENGELEITGYQNTSVAFVNVNIPAEIGGRTVVGIGKEAFQSSAIITSVTFPASIEYIDDYAFVDCIYLTELNLPSNLVTIGMGAFQNCASLKKVTFSPSLVSIGDHAFANCSSLMNFSLPNTLLTIGDQAFLDCISLTKVTVPTTVIELGAGAFGGCVNLSEVDLLGTQNPEDDAILAKMNAILADKSPTTFAEVTTALNQAGLFFKENSERGTKFIWDKNENQVYGALTAEDKVLLASVNEALKLEGVADNLDFMISAMQQKGYDLYRLNACTSSDKFVWNKETNKFTTIYAGDGAFLACTPNTILSVTKGSVFAEYAKAQGFIAVTPAEVAENGLKIFSNNAISFYYPNTWEFNILSDLSTTEIRLSLGNDAVRILKSERDTVDDHEKWTSNNFNDYIESTVWKNFTCVNGAITKVTNANGVTFTKITFETTDGANVTPIVIYLISVEHTTYTISFEEAFVNAETQTIIEESFQKVQ